MNPHITLVRVIGAEFLQRKLRSLILIGAIVAVVLLGLMVWLVTISAWWWLLAVPVIAAIILGILAAFVSVVIIRAIRPLLNQAQTAAVEDFVDKLERVADNIGTPMFIIIFRVIRDTTRPRDPSYIQTVASDSTTLHSDFAALQKRFK